MTTRPPPVRFCRSAPAVGRPAVGRLRGRLCGANGFRVGDLGSSGLWRGQWLWLWPLGRILAVAVVFFGANPEIPNKELFAGLDVDLSKKDCFHLWFLGPRQYHRCSFALADPCGFGLRLCHADGGRFAPHLGSSQLRRHRSAGPRRDWAVRDLAARGLHGTGTRRTLGRKEDQEIKGRFWVEQVGLWSFMKFCVSCEFLSRTIELRNANFGHQKAALRGQVVTWGHGHHGCPNTSPAQRLLGASGGAFAVLAEGQLVTWGYADAGGDSSNLAPCLGFKHGESTSVFLGFGWFWSDFVQSFKVGFISYQMVSIQAPKSHSKVKCEIYWQSFEFDGSFVGKFGAGSNHLLFFWYWHLQQLKLDMILHFFLWYLWSIWQPKLGFHQQRRRSHSLDWLLGAILFWSSMHVIFLRRRNEWVHMAPPICTIDILSRCISGVSWSTCNAAQVRRNTIGEIFSKQGTDDEQFGGLLRVLFPQISRPEA